jgi:hypothetical protein
MSWGVNPRKWTDEDDAALIAGWGRSPVVAQAFRMGWSEGMLLRRAKVLALPPLPGRSAETNMRASKVASAMKSAKAAARPRKPRRPPGRPRVPDEKIALIQQLRRDGARLIDITKATGLCEHTVCKYYRGIRDPIPRRDRRASHV